MSDDARGWKIAVFGLVLALALGGICVCGGLGYLVVTAPQADQLTGRAEADGYADGPTSTSQDCVDRAYARFEQCGTIDPDCDSAGRGYLNACLRSAGAPDPDLCAAVPAETALLDLDFADRFCEGRGAAEGDTPCDALAGALVTYCSSR